MRGISDLLTLGSMARSETVSRARRRARQGLHPRHRCLPLARSARLRCPAADAQQLRRTAESILDEYEKVTQQSSPIASISPSGQEVLSRTRSRGWERLERFMEAMTSLRRQRGELITLQSMRYIDVDALAALEQETQARFLEVSAACAEFLLRDEAFGPLEEQLEALGGSIQELKRSLELPPLAEQLETLCSRLKLLTELVGELQVEDVESKTRILGKISETISLQNRTRSLLQSKRESLRVSEGRAEFAAQIQLLTQALASALASAESPESCDDERAD